MKKYPTWAIGTTTFILVFIVTLVFFGVRTARVPFDLVAPDYYEQEIAYQDRIDAIARTDKLEEQPAVEATPTDVVLSMPESLASKLTAGNFVLYRPSDAAHDVSVPIEPGTTEVKIDITDKPKGNWKARVHWEMDGLIYYRESSLLL